MRVNASGRLPGRLEVGGFPSGITGTNCSSYGLSGSREFAALYAKDRLDLVSGLLFSGYLTLAIGS